MQQQLLAYLVFLLVFCVVMLGSAYTDHYRYPWTIFIAGALGAVPFAFVLQFA